MRLTWLRRAVLAALAVLAVAGLWTLVVLVAVRGDLTGARDALEQARAADTDDVAPSLAAARADLQQAADRMGQPGPALIAALPALGRPVDAVAVTARAGLAVVSRSEQVLAAADGERPLLQDGAVDLDRLAEVTTVLQQGARATAGPVEDLVAQPLGFLPAVLQDPVREAQEELQGVPGGLEQAAAALRGLSGVLGRDGPQRLLVMLENNAELRATGGVVTVFAEATTDRGRLEITGFRDVQDVADTPPDVQVVPAPQDYVDLYGPLLANTTLWKNVNASPDVPTSSAVLAQVAAASLPQAPDAVLWFDVPAIAAVLEATGPATLPDGSVLTAEDAVDVLLSEAYLRVPDTVEGQAQRRAVLRGAADAVLGRLLGSGGAGASAADLARSLGEAAAGRHVAVWSAEDDVQADLLAAGIAGEVAADGGDLSSAAVHNLGGGDREGNKLDYYARREVAVRAVVGRDVAEVEQVVVVRNTTPVSQDLPDYVIGTGTPRVLNDLLGLALPAGAELLSFSRGEAVLDAEPEPFGDHAVVQDVVSLEPGTEATWRLRYRLPVEDGRYRLRLVPQPLAFDAELDVEVTAAEGLRLTTPVGSPSSRDGAAVVVDGPFDTGLELVVTAERPGLLRRTGDAVRRFWSEPVQLPG